MLKNNKEGNESAVNSHSKNISLDYEITKKVKITDLTNCSQQKSSCLLDKINSMKNIKGKNLKENKTKSSISNVSTSMRISLNPSLQINQKVVISPKEEHNSYSRVYVSSNKLSTAQPSPSLSSARMKLKSHDQSNLEDSKPQNIPKQLISKKQIYSNNIPKIKCNLKKPFDAKVTNLFSLHKDPLKKKQSPNHIRSMSKEDLISKNKLTKMSDKCNQQGNSSLSTHAEIKTKINIKQIKESAKKFHTKIHSKISSPSSIIHNYSSSLILSKQNFNPNFNCAIRIILYRNKSLCQ